MSTLAIAHHSIGDIDNLWGVRVRVDLHMHSAASFDCRVPEEEVWRRCRALGLGPIFVTDHDTIDGALRLQQAHPGEVVVGQEITTRDGEIIGLFLERKIPSGLPASQAIALIKGQGGIVYLQHPYDEGRRSLKAAEIERLSPMFDVVEVFNGRSDSVSNRRAEELCAILDVPAGAGSDAHRKGEIGRAFVEMRQFSGPMEFLSNLRDGKVVRRPSHTGLKIRASLERFAR
jgi:hypothetical protein